MGKSSLRRVNWCIVIQEEVDGSKVTMMEGVNFVFESITFKIFLGPKETPDSSCDYPHHHGMISSPKSITKSRALKVMSNYFGVTLKESCCQPLDTTVSKYIQYAWKTVQRKKRPQEDCLDQAIKRIKSSGSMVTSDLLEQDLRIHEGVKFVADNQQLIKTAFRISGVVNEKKVLERQLDQNQNMLDTLSAISNFKDVVFDNVTRNGIATTCSLMLDSTNEEQAAAIICIALMPSLFQRVRDDLPALLFWGLPNSGKSYIFESNASFRKVPMDSNGVSRYRLESSQSAFLLDDVKVDALDKPENSATLRQLCLGVEARIKTFGDTQSIRGFVVATSNEKPTFLSDNYTKPENVDEIKYNQWRDNEQRNRDAWKRRFICLEFDKHFDKDYTLEIVWEHDSSLYSVCQAVKQNYALCSEAIKEKLHFYVENLDRYDKPELHAKGSQLGSQVNETPEFDSDSGVNFEDSSVNIQHLGVNFKDSGVNF